MKYNRRNKNQIAIYTVQIVAKNTRINYIKSQLYRKWDNRFVINWRNIFAADNECYRRPENQNNLLFSS